MTRFEERAASPGARASDTMDDTARMTGAAERRPRRRETADTARGAGRKKAGGSPLDELHQPLDTAWEAVNEVARLVDEIHRKRGRRRIR